MRDIYGMNIRNSNKISVKPLINALPHETFRYPRMSYNRLAEKAIYYLGIPESITIISASRSSQTGQFYLRITFDDRRGNSDTQTSKPKEPLAKQLFKLGIKLKLVGPPKGRDIKKKEVIKEDILNVIAKIFEAKPGNKEILKEHKHDLLQIEFIKKGDETLPIIQPPPEVKKAPGDLRSMTRTARDLYSRSRVLNQLLIKKEITELEDDLKEWLKEAREVDKWYSYEIENGQRPSLVRHQSLLNTLRVRIKRYENLLKDLRTTP